MRNIMPVIVAMGTLLMGGMFISHTAPGHIPDIWAHTYRISGILNGDVLARPVESTSRLHHSTENVGGHVDWSWIDYSHEQDDGYDPTVVQLDSITASDASGADVPYNNTATNSPVSYLPQLAGFAIGKAMGLSAGTTYYLTETIMLVVYACCTAIAVALLPKWRILVGVVMLCPLLLHRYSFAISADSMTQALTFLLSCMLVRALFKRIGVGTYVAFAIVCLLLAMCKFIYTPLVLLTLLVPWIQRGMKVRASSHGGQAERLASAWRDGIWITALGNAAAFIWLAVWMKLTGWFVTTPMMVSHAQMTQRRQALFTDPGAVVELMKMMALSIVTGRSNLNRTLDTWLIRCCWLAMAIMALALIVATVRRTLNGYETAFWWCASIVMVGIILLTYMALWLQYTPAGSVMIEGMQHRYFLPLVVLGVLCTAESFDGLLLSRDRVIV
ncbi:DUF2142 domain-containing protein [Bifidobacterium simiarum]|uniref:DUF2142 domain-containing protein n=1 Tax=Bifidobacterium simiarum TaxID=2045441 RepID=UPI001BDD792C|nr:DUF2142 domain-containing protein [Bifidobacterium simiarum]MBT1166195.1 DUF2142 domain-containing protein [Bifidobacterium simiarum]